MKQVTLRVTFTATEEELEEGRETIYQMARAKLEDGQLTTEIEEVEPPAEESTN